MFVKFFHSDLPQEAGLYQERPSGSARTRGLPQVAVVDGDGSGPVLRVDQVDAAGADDDVVQVRFGLARVQEPVVQDVEPGREGVEVFGNDPLARGTGLPRPSLPLKVSSLVA